MTTSAGRGRARARPLAVSRAWVAGT